MQLAQDFTVSQSSLQDYVDCPRRFQLRHVQRLAWPALTAEPPLDNERFMRQGALFHRLVQQHLLGISADRLADMLSDEQLREWWQNYQQAHPDPQGGLPHGLAAETHAEGKRCLTEISLSTPLGKYRLVGKFDALVISNVEEPRRAKILEWKTSYSRPRPAELQKRIQTRVYPYLLVRAGSSLNGGEAFQPEHIEMIYWFARFPAQAGLFKYNSRQFNLDEEYLEGLLSEIEARGETDFPLAQDEKHCRYCVYRSLCDRGVRASPLEDELADQEGETSPVGERGEIEFSFEQIGEISF